MTSRALFSIALCNPRSIASAGIGSQTPSVKEGDELALVHMRERDDTVTARAAAAFIIADDASPPRSHIIARLR